MTNPSIYAAFERFWQHVVARLNTFISDSDLENYYTKAEVEAYHSNLEDYTD